VWVAGLAPGDHEVVLTVQDSAAQQAAAQATLRILPLGIPEGASPVLDGFCEDEGYTGGAQVQLEPYADRAQATVHLLRSEGYLWACFSGMARGSGTPVPFAALRVDPDHSQDAQPQVDDYGFYVREDGGFSTYAGNGSGGFADLGANGLQAQVSANDNAWSAELQVDASVLGGWGHLAGLDLAHHWVRFQGDDYHWPYDSAWNKPDTWADSTLGTLPWIAGLEPGSATAGGAAFDLVVTGDFFLDGAGVQWDGTSLPTDFGGKGLLTATVDAAQIATPGEVVVTVRNPGAEDFLESNPVSFIVYYPVPEITELEPDRATAGGPAFILTVNGTGFADGSRIFWNDQALPTTYASASRLTAEVEAALIAGEGIVAVTVDNPGPGGGISRVATFTVLPVWKLYLPLILHNWSPVQRE
jgi:hypothetical protein